ncbi:MAG: cytochrome c peroxidase [Bacteroidetes bacterium]|nr:MAG: cytochrome c peroxidase [Bacteroidota bacterium]
MNKRIAALTLTITIVVIACRKDDPIIVPQEHTPALPAQPYDYVSASAFPSSFLYPPLSFINSEPQSNPTTDWGATLGRVLFYDTQLSANNAVSCASCHKQQNGFSDPARFSRGFAGGHTDRNSMAILNTRFSFRFFWDRRANGLEEQVMMPVMNAVEMGTDTVFLPAKLSAISYYPGLFEHAFGTTEISNTRIARALAQFVRSINSWNSKYDEGLQNNFTNFTPEENDGRTFFMSGQFNCNHCHTTSNFYTTQALNNGLESVVIDSGYALVTGDPADIGKFKVPTLRNIGVTGPYMHDGRFATLEDVVEHYNSGIQGNPNLDDRLTVEAITGGTPKQYNMTAYQKAALVAFLKTLTDEGLMADPKYSDPFVH